MNLGPHRAKDPPSQQVTARLCARGGGRRKGSVSSVNSSGEYWWSVECQLQDSSFYEGRRDDTEANKARWAQPLVLCTEQSGNILKTTFVRRGGTMRSHKSSKGWFPSMCGRARTSLLMPDGRTGPVLPDLTGKGPDTARAGREATAALHARGASGERPAARTSARLHWSWGAASRRCWCPG